MPLNKNLIRAIKILLFIALWWAIYQQLFSTGSLWDLFIYDWKQLNNKYQWTALVLVAVNWSLEAWKWRILLEKNIPQTFFTALKSVLGGISLALFTPNRIGEYGGRVWHLPESIRWKAVIALLVGNMLQLSVNLIIGSIGLIGYSLTYPDKIPLIWAKIMTLFLSITILILLYCLLNKQQPSYLFNWIRCTINNLQTMIKKGYQRLFSNYQNNQTDTHYLSKDHWLNKYITKQWNYLQQSILQVHLDYTIPQLRKIWLISLFRYIIYAGQYVLLLKAMGIENSWTNLFTSVLTAYFIQTILPTVAILELGIKGNIALYIFQPFCQQNAPIITATLLLWCYNLALPALIGAICLTNRNKNFNN